MKKTVWIKVKPHSKKITAIWAKKNFNNQQRHNKFRSYNNNSKRCKWDSPIILLDPIKAMGTINRKWIRNTIKIMTLDSKRLLRMIRIWMMTMMNPEKNSILTTADKEQWTSRKRKVSPNNNKTLKTVMTLKLTIIRLIITNKGNQMKRAKRNMIQKMNKLKCQKAMIGTKRRKIEIITRIKRNMSSN